VSRRAVVLRGSARQDIDKAVAFYIEEGASASAHRLIDELAEALETIARHPETGSPRYAQELDLPGLRSWILRRHPYLLFYKTSGGTVEVWRVLHTARDIPDSLRSAGDA